jgi:hypothetical protein
MLLRAGGETDQTMKPEKRVCAYSECTEVFTVTAKHPNKIYHCHSCAMRAHNKQKCEIQKQRKADRAAINAGKEKERKTIPCLECDYPFVSLGIGNRICDHCKNSVEWRYEI